MIAVKLLISGLTLFATFALITLGIHRQGCNTPIEENLVEIFGFVSLIFLSLSVIFLIFVIWQL